MCKSFKALRISSKDSVSTVPLNGSTIDFRDTLGLVGNTRNTDSKVKIQTIILLSLSDVFEKFIIRFKSLVGIIVGKPTWFRLIETPFSGMSIATPAKYLETVRNTSFK
jgi:hypothetical protein